MGSELNNKEFYVSEFRRIWTDLATTGQPSKGSVLGAKQYLNCCPTCEWAAITYDAKESHLSFCDPLSFCDHCFVDWGTLNCTTEDSLYKAWCNANTFEERRRIAALIAALPIREGLL